MIQPSSEEIDKAANQWLNGFFSWEDVINPDEVDCAREGFLAGVNWIIRLKSQEG